jgi:hypothetical protein
MDDNIIPCLKCNAETSFENSGEGPAEGQVCDVCDEWVCNNCTDFANCVTEEHEILCTQCSNGEN